MAASGDDVARAVELALAPGAHAWLAVAARSGLVVGVLLANPIVSIEYGGGALWIEELYVESAHRRRGAGRALYQFVADEARRAGLSAIELEVDPSLDGAEPFWRGLGFRAVERRRFDRAL
jgi:GNAT superfamily N-acetyltransferase